MVSSEGACAAYYTYGRFREAAEQDVAGRGRGLCVQEVVVPVPAGLRLVTVTAGELSQIQMASVGPDGIGVVDPETLGPALQVLVGFAVAVILFEGGLSLRLAEIRETGRVVLALVTVGIAVTWLLTTLSAAWVLCH